MPETSITFDPSDIADYQTYLKVRDLPVVSFTGRTASFPSEYAERITGETAATPSVRYKANPHMFDYQEAITATALRRMKFAVFADCGLGKTLILLDFARTVRQRRIGSKVLIVSPKMVIAQTMAECCKFYGEQLLERVHARDLGSRLMDSRPGILITNYEALHDDLPIMPLDALLLDESSMLKSHYGAWGRVCIRLGQGVPYKLCLTGTPAPNDRIEYANHAVFLDAVRSVNAFLAQYFVNRGQTDNRWELKAHALRPFYRHLSHWSIFLRDPAVYGWNELNLDLPPINIEIHPVPLTDEQTAIAYDETGTLFADRIGGITSRSVLSQLAKGWHAGRRISTNKPKAIRRLVESWPDESTIVWCHFNAEQRIIAETFPDAANISGDTPDDVRERLIEEFKRGERRILISKPKILGFGLNLQVATRQVFSGIQDSYEAFYQAVKRSNRIGADRPLNVHIPVTDIERPMMETVLRKSRMVDDDTREQERIYAEYITQ